MAPVTASTSCSSARDDGAEVAPVDASVDAPADASAEASSWLDAGSDGRPDDAGTFDAAPLTVECDSPSCAVSLASSHSESFCALLHDGTVVCWGANGNGELGRGETSSGSATPARVVGLSDIVALDHTCALDRTGAAWCWGAGPFLQGDGGVTTEPAPVKLALPPAKKVSVYRRTGCAVVDEGVLCWGSNEFGQVAPDAPFNREPSYPPRAVAFEPGAPIRDLAVNEASFIVREDGTSESWGANALVARGTSLFPDPVPLPTTLPRIGTVDVVENRACVAADGDAYCWGDDVGAIPRRVPTPEPVVQIATTRTIVDPSSWDGSRLPSRWCAAAPSGSVFCLGDNNAGQAGDGTKNHASRPVKLAGLPERAAQVRTTRDTTCALLTNGEVYCVGNNYYGQLGDGQMRRSSLKPVKVNLP
jgi:alpha-tubulin suppressor-like RCC1 family protein